MEPPVASDETVLRRYDPSNKSHFAWDEKLQKARFRSGGLRFDPEGDTTGCSVFRRRVLENNGLSPADVLEDVTWTMVEALVADIRAVVRDGLHPFDVVADPYPRDIDDPPLVDAAHALITYKDSLPRNAKKKLHQRLASDVFREASGGSS